MSGTVTKLRPADAEELLGMVEELGRRVDYLTRVAEQHEGKLVRNATALDEHAEALDAHEDRLDRHEDRLNDLDAALPKRAPSLAERVEAWINTHPGLRLTATTVAESMDLPDLAERKRVHSAMASLANAGRIGVVEREGRHRVFYALPAGGAA